MESELRPCPFCGNLKPIRATKFVKPIRATKFAYGWKVSCRCGAKVSYKQTEDEAIAVWNARASDWQEITPENLPPLELPVLISSGYEHPTSSRATVQSVAWLNVNGDWTRWNVNGAKHSFRMTRGFWMYIPATPDTPHNPPAQVKP